MNISILLRDLTKRLTTMNKNFDNQKQHKNQSNNLLLKKKLKLFITFSYENVQQHFCNTVHQRDSKGRFSDKGIMELSTDERKLLLAMLENQEYETFEGIQVSKRKIQAVKAGRYKDEIDACKILTKLGFNVHLLEENYVKGKKADTFYEKNGDKDFLEIKSTKNEAARQYNRSIEQASSAFIMCSEKLTYGQKEMLKKAILQNKNAKIVILVEGESVTYLKK